MQEKRLEKKILITNKLGLHARAAAKFVSLTSKCESRFVVKKGKNVVSGSSLLGLMTLAASKGTEIKVQCIGNKAEQDLEKLIVPWIEIDEDLFYSDDLGQSCRR